MSDDQVMQPKKPGRAIRMSANNGDGWRPRKTETLECPSGQIVQVRRPGPEFMLRAGRVARTFSRVAAPEVDGGAEAQGLAVLESMNDEELAAVLIFARELVCAMLVSPRLVKEPRPNTDEVGPDDIGDDFWFLFNYAMEGYFGLTVPVGNQEVQVTDLHSFRSEPGVSGDSNNRETVRDLPEPSIGDQGLERSA